MSEPVNERNMVREPKPEWGGSWTEKKLDAFEKYVSAYLRIMKPQKEKLGWKTIYFDGFAGSGDRIKTNSCETLDIFDITEEEENLYKGAAERVLNLKEGLSFDFHYFIDNDKIALANLESKLSKYQAGKIDFQYKNEDSNVVISDLAQAMKKGNYASLILLDPFGMHINWNAIEKLKGTHSDVWILLPAGVIINRLLDKKCELKSYKILESFLGIPKEEIEATFYRKENHDTLFGPEEKIRKISKPIEKIAEVYTQRLKTIWKFVTEKPLRLENTRGVPIFHFVFASNNPTGVKIASQIIDKA